MNSIKLAWLLFKRDWRAGDLRVLLFAMIVAITCLCSIGLFTDRVDRALKTQTAILFGGELVVETNQPIALTLRQQAAQWQLRDSVTLSYLSMVAVKDKFQLAVVKAVDAHYPLLGELGISPEKTGVVTTTQHGPSENSVWLSPRLATSLALQAQDTLKVGAAYFNQFAYLLAEPDATNEWSLFAPRLMMRLEDVTKTKILQPGSRVSYRWALTGAPENIEKFQIYIQKILPEARILSAAKNQPTLSNILGRSTDYFNLASLLSVVLTTIACGIAIRRYTERHFRYVALLRTFGMVQWQVFRIYFWNVLGLAIIAATIGATLGIISQWLLDAAFANFMTIPLPAISLRPIFYAIVLVLLTLFGVGSPHLLRLKNVPTLHILRKEMLPVYGQTINWYVLTMVFAVAMSLAMVQNFQLGYYFLIGIIAMTLFLIIIGWLMLVGLQSIRGQLSSVWRFGIANVHRYRANSLVLLTGFGFSIMILLLMWQIQSGLLQDWRESLPVGTPNYFIVNIPSENVNDVEKLLARHSIISAGFYPIIRGRLQTLNGKPFSAAVPAAARSDEALQRSLNLTWQASLPEKNKLIAGKWWNASTQEPVVSVERNFAERLHIKLNDNIGVAINDQEITAKVINIREVNWVSFRPTFYMIYPPNILQKFPASYLTSVYLPNQNNILLAELVEQFPSVSVIDIASVTARIQGIMNNVSHAILYILLFIAIASLSILLAGIQASITDRQQAVMILHALGTTNRQLTIVILIEFLIIGAIAGVIAGLGAIVIQYFLSTYLFQLSLHQVWWSLLYGPLLGMTVVAMVGFFASRALLRQPADTVLRSFEN